MANIGEYPDNDKKILQNLDEARTQVSGLANLMRAGKSDIPLDRATEVLDNVTQFFDEFELHCNSMTGLKNNLKKQLKDLHNKHTYIQKAYKTLDETYKQKMEETAKKEAEMAKILQEVSQMKEEIAEKQAAIAELTNQLKSFQEDVNRLEDKAQKAEELQEENEELRAVLNERQERLESKMEGETFTNMGEIPDEYDGDDMTSVQQVKKSLAINRKLGLSSIFEKLSKRLSEQPNHTITKQIIEEFGSIQEFSKAVTIEENSRLIICLLKALEQEMDQQPVIEEYNDINPSKHYHSASSWAGPYRRKSAECKESEVLIHYGKKKNSYNSKQHSQQPSLSYWNEVLNGKSVIDRVKANERLRVKQVFNPYTKRGTGYFDPHIQYGGKSILTDLAERGYLKPKGGKYKVMMEELDEGKNRVENEECLAKLMRIFPERPPWGSTKEFFEQNGSDSPMNRTPSPDKITTSRRLPK